ncbi:MAG: hypothetical protein N3E47_07785 [Candidatus Bathyarchaeota archaeon]|nr:hypothetical protein [Candidatus Bathyarchaeota archaeon]
MRKLILVLIVLSALLFTAYCCYSLGSLEGYRIGYEVGYRVSYETGYTLGNQTGFTQGYYTGFKLGNETGYSLGYESGFKRGKYSGYEQGYEIGYSTGFKAGNSTGFSLGYETGYLQGVIDGIGRGFTIRDPTYMEAMNFVKTDQTDKNKYVERNYTCINFAADFKMNAFKMGCRCGLVYIEFPESAHTLVCFNTTDEGLIFIEPQTDCVVRVEVGIRYWRDNGYLYLGDDTIVRYLIIW